MAIGNPAQAHSSVANAAYLTIQPSGVIAWRLLAIYAGGNVEIYRTDGTNEVLVDTLTGGGMWSNFENLLTNGYYFRVKNVSGVAIYIGYDAVITKE